MDVQSGCLVADEHNAPEVDADTCPEVCPHCDTLRYCEKPWAHSSSGHICSQGHYW